MNRRTLATIVAFGVLAAGCASPSTPIGMREYPGNIAYADESRPEPPPPPLAADPAPAFPGFVSPPAPRTPVVEPVGDAPPVTTTTTTTLVPVACPADDPLAVPTQEAGFSIPGTPLPGGYPFRQEGTVEADGEVTALPDEVVHRVDGIEALPEGSARYTVAVESGDAATLTTYEVSRRGVDDGLHIVQIRTEDSFGIDAFTPSLPLKVLPTPPVIGEHWSSVGADPLQGIALQINARVTGKTRVNACGEPLEAWLVEVGESPDTGLPSRIVGPGKMLTITGTYAVATQMGGLIVAEDLTLSGSDGGRQVEIIRRATINRTTPDR